MCSSDLPNMPTQPPAQPPTVPLPGPPSPAPGVPAQPPSVPAPARIIPSMDMFHYLITTRQFDKDVAAFQANANLTTGFLNMDAVQPLYPGLYCLGAISSLGKTTLVHQMADQIAAMGRYVLYFSLEQTPFELCSKSLARGFFQTYLDMMRVRPDPYKSVDYPTPSSVNIRRGNIPGHAQELAQEIDRYANLVRNRMIVVNNMFSLTVDEIVSATRSAVAQLGVKPVVIIDYLQIIAPTPINGRIPDTKTSIDYIVHTLKAMQADLDLTVIAISSLNRQNYLTPIAYESFKESGGLEYTTDVLWGLELSIMQHKRFYNDIDDQGNVGRETSLKKKREYIRRAKASTPREIDLVCLKNRYGRSSYRVQFLYYPAHDYIEPYFGNVGWTSPDSDLVAPPPGELPTPAHTVLKCAIAPGEEPEDY